MEHSTQGSQEKSPRMWLQNWRNWGRGQTWSHPLCFQRDFNQPNTLYALKTRSLHQITSPDEASCTNLLNPNIEVFFSLSTLRVPWTSRRSILSVRWKDWWSWNSNSLATWYKELTHWKKLWCWERLKAEGEGDDRGWVGWMASLTQWTWV